MKSLQDLIFGEKFQQGATKAVQEAVAKANAAGLPKAYLDSFDQVRQHPPKPIDKATDERGK